MDWFYGKQAKTLFEDQLLHYELCTLQHPPLLFRLIILKVNVSCLFPKQWGELHSIRAQQTEI